MLCFHSRILYSTVVEFSSVVMLVCRVCVFSSWSKVFRFPHGLSGDNGDGGETI